MGSGEWGMGNESQQPTPHSPFPTPHSLRLLLHNSVVNLEVGVDALDVFVIIERVVKFEHLRGMIAVELDGVLRNHGDLRGDWLDAFALDRVEDGEEIFRGGQDLIALAVVL